MSSSASLLEPNIWESTSTGGVEPALRGGATSPTPTVVVVGNGMVGLRLCERLRERDPQHRLKIIVLGEEPRPAYDRVQLTKYFDKRDPDALCMADHAWYETHAVELRLGVRVERIDREARTAHCDDGSALVYDALVLATGSAAFVPPIPGANREGTFVYRTIEDLEAIVAYAKHARSAAVIGGGLLGLEAARAVVELGLETHVVELAKGLMPRQLDQTGSRLLERSIRALGVSLHLGKSTSAVVSKESLEAPPRSADALSLLEAPPRSADALSPNEAVGGLQFSDESVLPLDMVVFSAGIKPRDELARACGLTLGQRGGVVIDDGLRTSDPSIYAIGEVALHRGMIYGLVAPGYDMAATLAKRLTGEPSAAFEGGDLSAKLKLLGVDVASFGDPFAEGEHTNTVAIQDFVSGVYKKLIVNEAGDKLLGGMLVGDVKEYATLAHLARTGEKLPVSPDQLILGDRKGGDGGGMVMPDAAQVCSCHNLTKGDLCTTIRDKSLTKLDEIKLCTKAGTGCGGCVPIVTDLLNAELKARGATVKNTLCEHFDYSRQELFQIVMVTGITSFDELLQQHGQGYGCEICKPACASIFASLHNDMILERHATLQDTNDRFLANIQRRGLYSIVPRVAGGEITPDKLIKLGEVAKKYGLYTKITGGQRIDMFGARVNQLPDIWEELVDAGFESGHAYGKAMRTVKSCVGSTWCRYGVQDSVGLAIRIENRYRGVRTPHKFKSAVSGCVRECAEAQSKDFGVIATERGYNLYVCGNGGAKPRHADLFASDLDEPTLIRYIDRFLMFYIRTADRLTRTSVWLEKLEGGLPQLKAVILEDKLGICEELERQMQHLVDTYECEWAAVVRDPKRRAQFRHFANSEAEDDSFVTIRERGQVRPADWEKKTEQKPRRVLPLIQTRWIRVASIDQLPANGGINVKHGNLQIAVFRFAARGEMYATQNMCPHKQDMVLSRGLLGDHKGEPKVACPTHKKTFSLQDGRCLSGDDLSIRTFPVKVENDQVWLELPPSEQLESELCPGHDCVAHEAGEAAE